MSEAGPFTDFFCPVCGQDRRFLYLWQQPDSDRIRIFCEDCRGLFEYHDLPKEQCTILSEDGFGKFAGARLLRHVLAREREKGSSQGSSA